MSKAALLVFIEEKREKRVNSNEEKLAYPLFFFKNAKVFCQASTVSFGALAPEVSICEFHLIYQDRLVLF